ncbi:MAG: ABC transporter permease [Thiobacillaceae bacterium]|nr:ABC transporter permease [Thiobacillaceae bacterium]
MTLPFQPVILWSDALLLMLLAAVAAFVLHTLRHEHLRAPWRAVWDSRLGMAAAVVLAAYGLIGLLDSLHFRARLPAAAGEPPQYAAEVLSLFDHLVGPLRTQVEESYSAPFATHLFVKKTLVTADGRVVRDYPRLKYGGAHLPDPQGRWADVAARGIEGAGLGSLLAAGAWGLAALGLAVHRRQPLATALAALARERTLKGPRAALLTLTLLVLLTGAVAALAPHYHVLGTDKVGQDVLYLALKSIRTGLLIGTLTTLVVLPLALTLGVAAGYFGGWVDDVIQYLYTTINSIPGVLLIAAAVLVAQVHIETNPQLYDTAAARSDLRLVFLCLILGLTGWVGLARLLRGETLKLRELEYVQAARAFGVTHARILVRHVLPNVAHLVLITLVLDFSGLVLAEAVLSYVGVGVDPVMPSWGNMINGARLELAREPVVWWQLAAAFLFMFVLVLAANLFADSVRAAFDPRSGRIA